MVDCFPPSSKRGMSPLEIPSAREGTEQTLALNSVIMSEARELQLAELTLLESMYPDEFEWLKNEPGEELSFAIAVGSK